MFISCKNQRKPKFKKTTIIIAYIAYIASKNISLKYNNQKEKRQTGDDKTLKKISQIVLDFDALAFFLYASIQIF